MSSHWRSRLIELLRLVLPVLGTLALDPLVSIVDTAFVGHLGSDALAALSVGTSTNSLLVLSLSFLTWGTTSLIAEARGKQNTDPQNNPKSIATQAMILGLLLGSLVTLCLWGFSDGFLSLMGTKPENFSETRSYYLWRASAAPAIVFLLAASGIYRGYQDTSTPLYIAILLNVTNFLLDAFFIKTLQMGSTGAGIATFGSQWIAAITMFILIRRKLHPLLFTRSTINFQLLWEFLKINGSISIRTISILTTFAFATSVANRAGTEVIAAHQVTWQFWLAQALLLDSLAVGGQTLVAKYIGAKNYAEAWAICNFLIISSLVFSIILSFSLYLLIDHLIPFFSQDTEVLALIRLTYPILFLSQPINSLVFILDGLFMGMRAFRFLAIQMLFSSICASIGLWITLENNLGILGVWYSIVILMLSRVLTLSIKYYRLPWTLHTRPT